jgi:hypothetical protein
MSFWACIQSGLYYINRMTGEALTIRPRHSKHKLRLAMGENLSSRINDLIDYDLAQSGDWRDILKGPRPAITEEQFEACMTLE